MDYQGNYFTDEPDEPMSKGVRIVKGIFKWTMYGISFVIYAILFYLLFINRDSKILEKNYMHQIPEYKESITEEVELFRINTPVFMNDDGSLQLHNIDYTDEFGIIEIGIKYNANKHTDGEKNNVLDYVLIDSEDNYYPLSNIVTEGRGRYGFARISFTGIDIDLDSNELRYDYENKPHRVTTQYKLQIYRKSDNNLLHEFVLYDNSVTFNHTDYVKGAE